MKLHWSKLICLNSFTMDYRRLSKFARPFPSFVPRLFNLGTNYIELFLNPCTNKIISRRTLAKPKYTHWNCIYYELVISMEVNCNFLIFWPCFLSLHRTRISWNVSVVGYVRFWRSVLEVYKIGYKKSVRRRLEYSTASNGRRFGKPCVLAGFSLCFQQIILGEILFLILSCAPNTGFISFSFVFLDFVISVLCTASKSTIVYR